MPCRQCVHAMLCQSRHQHPCMLRNDIAAHSLQGCSAKGANRCCRQLLDKQCLPVWMEGMRGMQYGLEILSGLQAARALLDLKINVRIGLECSAYVAGWPERRRGVPLPAEQGGKAQRRAARAHCRRRACRPACLGPAEQPGCLSGAHPRSQPSAPLQPAHLAGEQASRTGVTATQRIITLLMRPILCPDSDKSKSCM